MAKDGVQLYAQDSSGRGELKKISGKDINSSRNLSIASSSLDSGGSVINPSTEEKQDDIIESIKAEDSPHVSGDKGIMPLTVRCDDLCVLAGTDGDYQPLITNEDGILRTQAQQHYHIDCCGATTDWTVLGNDTANFTTTTNHVLGTLALEFDKIDGSANTVFAGIQKTITSIDLTPYHKGGGFFCCSIYVSNTTDINYAFLRVGTDSSNYNEWRGDQEDMTAGWNCFKKSMLKPDSYTGNGWNNAAVTYIAIGVAFGSENDTLANIAVDHIATNTGLQTTTDILQTTIPSMNLLKVGNKIVNIGAGNADTGTQRVSISTDDINLAAINTATTSKLITGIGHGVKTVSTAGTDEALAGSTACKKIAIQAQTDNTGLIAIGATGVDATVATGTGILLYAGDSFELEIDNLADIYIDSTVNGDGVRYTYFT